MKRIGLLLLSLMVCLSMVGCSQAESKKTSKDKSDKGAVVTTFESATTESTTTTTTKPTTKATTKPQKEIHWTEQFYVDDFGDPTSSSYIRGVFKGKFSNSATSGSDLTVCFFMDKNLASASYDMFTIRLLEYGNHQVSFIGCDEYDVSIKVKVDGVVTEDNPYFLLKDDGEIAIKRGSGIFKAVINALEADKEIAFVITIGGYGTPSTYRFDVDANGLSDISHKWKGTL